MHSRGYEIVETAVVKTMYIENSLYLEKKFKSEP